MTQYIYYSVHDYFIPFKQTLSFLQPLLLQQIEDSSRFKTSRNDEFKISKKCA